MYDYGWYVTYTGPASELVNFIDDLQLFYILRYFNLLNKTLVELENELVTAEIFVKSNTLGTKIYFLDVLQLTANSLFLSLYLIAALSVIFFNYDLQNSLYIDTSTQCLNYGDVFIPFYFYDFYFYDFYLLI